MTLDGYIFLLPNIPGAISNIKKNVLDLQRRQQELERLEAAKRERMRVHGSHLGNNGGGIFGGVVPGGVSDIDRSSTIFGGAPRPGANGSGLFFGGSSGPGNSGSTIPSSSVVARSAGINKFNLLKIKFFEYFRYFENSRCSENTSNI